MLPRLLLAALLTLLLISPPAHATTYCVGISCEGFNKPTIDAALTAAASSPGKDTIRLGSGPFTGSWSITAANPVDLIGPQTGARLISTGNAGLTIDAPEVSVENIDLRTHGVNAAYGVYVRAPWVKLIRVGVTDAPGTKLQVGFRVVAGAQLNSVATTMSTPGSVGILATGAPTAPLQVYNADLTGQHGLRVWDWTKPVRVDRLRVKATNNAVALSGVPDFSGESMALWGGLGAFEATASAGTIRHATLANGPTGGSALWAKGSPLKVSDSVLVGRGEDLYSDTPIEFRRSAFRPARMEGPITQPGADNIDLTQSWHGLPSVIAGELEPVSGSALIDAGTPGPDVSFDADNKPRPVDGDRDGIARRDIGAFEAIEKTSVAPAKVALVDPNPKPVVTPTPTPVVTPVATPVPTPRATPPGPTVIPTPPPAKPRVTIGMAKNRVLGGRTTGSVARVQVAARRSGRCATKAGKLRRAKRCAWLKTKGTTAWSLRLPRGTYTVTARGLDARGKVVATAKKRVRVG